jgi:hypothetical protein
MSVTYGQSKKSIHTRPNITSHWMNGDPRRTVRRGLEDLRRCLDDDPASRQGRVRSIRGEPHSASKSHLRSPDPPRHSKRILKEVARLLRLLGLLGVDSATSLRYSELYLEESKLFARGRATFQGNGIDTMKLHQEAGRCPLKVV